MEKSAGVYPRQLGVADHFHAAGLAASEHAIVGKKAVALFEEMERGRGFPSARRPGKSCYAAVPRHAGCVEQQMASLHDDLGEARVDEVDALVQVGPQVAD